MTDAAAVPTATKRTLADKIFYGIGSIAYGVKDNGFGVLLLLFYNQVLGLPAATVGLAIALILVSESVIDPVLGHISDNWRSRWGRRHPFMYASILPLCVFYIALWNPPAGLSDGQLLAYLVVVAFIVRFCVTMYEVPSSALVTDLTTDYNQRTSFLSFRYFFGWYGGLAMNILAFSVFLRPTAEYPAGQLNPTGYVLYGVASAVIMGLSILATTLGTHRLIPTFHQPPPKQKVSLGQTMKEIGQTLSNKPFLIVAVAGMVNYMAFGLGGAMITYMRTYFWELTGDQISIVTAGAFGSALVGLLVAPRLSHWFGKKRAWLGAVLLQVVLNPTVYLLRLFDVMPPNGSTSLVVILTISSFVTTTLLVVSGILTSSMIADAVEHGQIKTGRRADGFYFAFNSFMLKCLAGFGIAAAGMILGFVNFPENAVPGQVPDDVLVRLMLIEVSLIAGLQALALAILTLYPITKAKHEANLRSLEEPVNSPKMRESGEAAQLAERGGLPAAPAGASPA